MRYFIIERKDVYRPRIILPYTINEQINIKRGKIESVDKVAIWKEKESEFTFFSDILTDPLLLLSGRAKEVVQMYDRKMTFKQIVLFGEETENVMLYYLPLLSEISGEWKGENQVTIHGMDVGIIGKAPMLRLKTAGKIRYLVNLEITESFLKRRMTGMDIEIVDIFLDREI